MNVLFVCKSNVARSQMAEEFYKKYIGENVKSAGYDPTNWEGANLDTTSYVKLCMDEEGMDVRQNISKRVTPEMVDWADRVMIFDSNKDSWPDFLRNSEKVEVWEVKDPRHGDFETHRETTKEIKDKIKSMASS